jgi:hypothetical protein
VGFVPGFVRAVAIAERSLLGSAPTSQHPGVAVIDEARRDGLRVILVSDRTVGELRRGGDTLLPHFDGVVAESGRALKVGAGPVRRVPVSSREALLEVLAELDVDPHDTLGVSGDASDAEMLGALEVAVGAGVAAGRRGRPGRRGGRGGGRTDYEVPGRGADALRRVLDDARSGHPSTSPARHDVSVTVSASGRPADVHVPGAHANLLVCAAGPSAPGAGDVSVQLVRRWAADGYSSVVVDLDRRHPGGTAVDPVAPGWLEALRVAMRARQTPVVLGLAGVPERERSAVLATAFGAVRAGRERSGRPHWLVIDPAAPVFADPDLPPEALDLSDSGHCFVLRDHRAVPAGLLTAADVVLGCGPSCPLEAGRR